MTMHMKPTAAQDGRIRVWISGEFLRDVQIQQIEPFPDEAQLSPTGTVFIFGLAQPHRSGDVILHFEPQTIGRLSGAVGLTDSRSIAFTQWIYP
jgi:hypothetical protein